MKKIISKEFRLANENEIDTIVKKLVLNLRDNEQHQGGELNQNEEIDSYIEYKKNISVTRTDILLDTKETIVLFDCLEITEMLNGVLGVNYHFILSNGKLKDISLDDFII